MNVKNDDGTTNDEQKPMPDLASPSDANYGTGRLAKEVHDYGAVLDYVRMKIEQMVVFPNTWEHYREQICASLQTVGK